MTINWLVKQPNHAGLTFNGKRRKLKQFVSRACRGEFFSATVVRLIISPSAGAQVQLQCLMASCNYYPPLEAGGDSVFHQNVSAFFSNTFHDPLKQTQKDSFHAISKTSPNLVWLYLRVSPSTCET